MKIKSEPTLLHGERPIENAPSIELGNGGLCIPQHYLLYQHTRLSVEKIVLDIDYNDRYLIFVCEDKGGIYIQIGIVGYDNYISLKSQKDLKVVYGRKWRVESQLPTSEIIQTVFLALKKAREHEARELFRFTHDKTFTTPFNNHHDLPLISQNADLVQLSEEKTGFESLKSQLESIHYDSAKLHLKTIKKLANEKWLIDIKIEPDANGQLPEINDMAISFLLDELSTNELYYQLMGEFLSLSDRHVDENFHYKGFARFSRKNSIIALAELSSILRKKSQDEEHHAFAQAYEAANYETDKSRVPKLYYGLLSDKIKLNIARFGQLEGILPD
ncbi:MAG: hypothetical protein COB49_00670 [Alphaproteobacteria bacterium]|nr:MAG: hypothetical protein COB49_00670 [Alphaproteobacteria bacterium]